MASADKEKTAFSVPMYGLWQFTVMPFGLCNAVGTFQRLMEHIFEKELGKSVMVYIDDLLVYGSTWEDMNTNLENVFILLEQNGLILNKKKCIFFQNEIEFLGHIVGGEGIKTNPKKISSIVDWSIPRCRTELKSFLGLASYYRRFVNNFSKIASPLFALTQDNSEFSFSEKEIEAFKTIKTALSHDVVLSYIDCNSDFILDVDASYDGYGAVLSQMKDGKEYVVEYFSASVSQSEKSYCATRLELSGLMKALKRFHHYLVGVKCTIRTDHSSLTFLKNFHRVEGQLARWLEQLQMYNLEIIHRPGKTHHNADALSRQKCNRTCLMCRQSTINSILVRDCSFDWSLEQSKDDEIVFVKNALLKDKRPDRSESFGKSKFVNILLGQWNSLQVNDGILTRICHVNNNKLQQVIVPFFHQRRILKEVHGNKMHAGVDKTKELIRKHYYWPGWEADVRRWVSGCLVCKSTNGQAALKKKLCLVISQVTLGKKLW